MGQETSGTTKLQIIVVDDHESVLDGTVHVLKREYPDANVLTAQTMQGALEVIQQNHPNLVVVDLSIPETAGATAHTESGIQLLRQLMQNYPTLNIVVQSAHTKSLVRLKPIIHTHQGGFTIADKSLSLKEMLTKVDWALQGLVYTPKEMRTGLEVKPEWLEVLTLAFVEGLKDDEIAKRRNISVRTVRHYWTQVQDALSVYPEEGKNLRVQTGIKAREAGLID